MLCNQKSLVKEKHFHSQQKFTPKWQIMASNSINHFLDQLCDPFHIPYPPLLHAQPSPPSPSPMPPPPPPPSSFPSCCRHHLHLLYSLTLLLPPPPPHSPTPCHTTTTTSLSPTLSCWQHLPLFIPQTSITSLSCPPPTHAHCQPKKHEHSKIFNFQCIHVGHVLLMDMPKTFPHMSSLCQEER